MFKIGDFSRLTQVTVKALRLYDSLGLLRPAHTDPLTGYRYYSSAQLPRLNRILALKDLGFSLEQIGQLLDADLSSRQLREMLLARQREVEQMVAAEQARLERIEARLRQVEEDNGFATYDVVVRPIPARQVASVRGTLSSRGDVLRLFERLLRYARDHGIEPIDGTTIWHDPAYRESEIEAEAAISSATSLPDDERVRVYDLPAVETMACLIHHGGPDTIGAACMAVLAWAEANHYQIDGPERVIMRQRFQPDQRSMVFEIQYPVTTDARD